MKKLFLLFLCAAMAVPAMSAPKIGRAVIFNAFTGMGGQNQDSAPYEILDADGVGDQCVKVLFKDPEAGGYKLEGSWFYDGDMSKNICDVVSENAATPKKGDIAVFCAPRCPEIGNAKGTVAFWGSVKPVSLINAAKQIEDRP